MRMSRGLVPGIAAAVVVFVVLAWWVIARGDDDTDKASPPAATPSAPQDVEPIPIEGYFPRSETVLALNYSIGVPACYGTAGEPEVVETDQDVTVTLTRVVPSTPTDISCIELAMMRSAVITLAEPLGKRVVRDGSYGGEVVERAPSAYDDGTEVDPTG